MLSRSTRLNSSTVLGVAFVGLVMLVATGPAYRLGYWDIGFIVSILRWAAYIGIAAMALSTLVAIIRFRKDRHGLGICVLAFAIGMFNFGMPYSLQRQAFTLPPIHDITTDIENPPTFVDVVPLRADAPNTLDYDPSVGAVQQNAYPDLKSLILDIRVSDAFDLALKTARNEGWEIVSSDKTSGLIEATDVTFWYGFKDDIVIRLVSHETGSKIDVRSVSRVGLGDLGANALRIRSFLVNLLESS